MVITLSMVIDYRDHYGHRYGHDKHYAYDYDNSATTIWTRTIRLFIKKKGFSKRSCNFKQKNIWFKNTQHIEFRTNMI